MNMQQDVQARSSSNGYGRRRIERDTRNKLDSGGGVLEFTSCDRLIYLTTCLIGHQVEVQVQDGSVFSGVFHATNAKDFGVVLKMAYLIKDGSTGQKNISNSSTKPPSRTLIIPAKDLVQVIAKDVTVTKDGFTNELQHLKPQELMTDSCISQSRHVELGRELERWVPDENDPSCPELENIFDSPWNRGWDQFEANETLFGVKSTFNEELYTTKLEKGPKMSEIERVALRIAREIAGEDTLDLHQAEERGIQIDGDLEIDEETRFSSVYRGVDDGGCDEVEDILLDSSKNGTFGGVSSSAIDKTPVDSSDGTTGDGAQASSRSSVGEVQSSVTSTSRDEESKEKLELHDQSQVSKAEDSHSFRSKKESSDKVGLSPNATAFDPSHASSKSQEKTSSSGESEGAAPPKTQGTTSSLAQPSSPASTTSDRGVAASVSVTRGLSPSSSASSLSSEKSTLNPHAKEFKFNPNAKSFIPSQSPLRPSSPVADIPFYYPANMTAAANMHGMPMSIGIGPPFAAQQPVMFNPQAAPMPQPYYHPNGPQYGQQMMVGQSRPVLYMPTYPPEMPYKGREF